MKSALKSQKGLSPIVIVVIVAVLGIGGFLVFNSSKGTPSSTTTTQNNNGTNNYYNPVHGAKFVYPSDWEKTEYNDPSIIHASFTKDEKATFIFLTDESSNLSNTTMDKYNVSAMKAVTAKPAFKLIEEKDVTINGQQFRQVMYTFNDEKNNEIKVWQIWTVTAKTGYGFAYSAPTSDYDTFLRDATTIIESVTLF